MTLAGKTMCIVGLGTIGTGIARRAKAMDMRVLGVRHSGSPVEGIDEVVTPAELHFVLNEADVTVVCCPLTERTRGLMGPQEFAAMKRGGFFIDVSRGGVTYLDSVIAALEGRHLAAAALDVFRDEPLPEHHPAWDTEGLIVTPHTGGLTRDYLRRVAEVFARNIQAVESGDQPTTLVDRSLGY